MGCSSAMFTAYKGKNLEESVMTNASGGSQSIKSLQVPKTNDIQIFSDWLKHGVTTPSFFVGFFLVGGLVPWSKRKKKTIGFS